MSIIRELARLGNKIDSASTGQFLSKGSTTGSFGTISYTDLTGRPTTLDSSAATSIIDSAYIQARQSAVGGGGLDSALTTQLIDSSYIAARAAAGSSGYQMYEYTATQGQTTFQDSDINGNILSYSEGGALVFYNGVLLGPSDITATSGSSVVLTTGADSGSHVAIAKWSLASGSGGASFSDWGGDRQIVAGGEGPSAINNIQYYSAANTGNASDFGDLTAASEAGANTSNAVTVVHLRGISDVLDKITVATTGNATSFGTLPTSRRYRISCTNGTYGVYMGGNDPNNDMDYITIATPGNGSDFGDLSVAKRFADGAEDGTYGFAPGGMDASGNTAAIDYITVATPGNATDFGDLTQAIRNTGCCSDTTRAVRAGGYTNTYDNPTIDYFTMATPSNASDFGDLPDVGRGGLRGSSDGTKGLFNGGRKNSTTHNNEINYVTIQTTANSSDFGDLHTGAALTGCASGSPS